jgi:energy-coupling factor transport system ATP-binding protein
MIKNPDMLILDEPTSGLDGKNMRVISRMMQKMAKGNTCVLVISHDLELIDAACSCELQLPL